MSISTRPIVICSNYFHNTIIDGAEQHSNSFIITCTQCGNLRTVCCVYSISVSYMCGLCIIDHIYTPDWNKRINKGSTVLLIMVQMLIPDLAKVLAVMSDTCNVRYMRSTKLDHILDVPHPSLWKGLYYVNQQ